MSLATLERLRAFVECRVPYGYSPLDGDCWDLKDIISFCDKQKARITELEADPARLATAYWKAREHLVKRIEELSAKNKELEAENARNTDLLAIAQHQVSDVASLCEKVQAERDQLRQQLEALQRETEVLNDTIDGLVQQEQAK